MKNGINISILGEKDLPKIELIKDYLKANNINGLNTKENLLSFNINKIKAKIYEYCETQEIKSKNIINNQCVIIIFDMTIRKSFLDILDKYIKYLREIKYNNYIILFGTGDKDTLAFTDEQEINYMIELTKIKGQFFDLRNMDTQGINNLIDKLVEKLFSFAQNNTNKKDCVIF